MFILNPMETVLTIFCPVDAIKQVTYTVGRDSQYQTTITADAAPLVKDPVIVCNKSLH